MFQDAVVASAFVDTSWHTTSRAVTVVDDLQRMKRQSDYHSVTSGCDVSVADTLLQRGGTNCQNNDNDNKESDTTGSPSGQEQNWHEFGPEISLAVVVVACARARSLAYPIQSLDKSH